MQNKTKHKNWNEIKNICQLWIKRLLSNSHKTDYCSIEIVGDSFNVKQLADEKQKCKRFESEIDTLLLKNRDKCPH